MKLKLDYISERFKVLLNNLKTKQKYHNLLFSIVLTTDLGTPTCISRAGMKVQLTHRDRRFLMSPSHCLKYIIRQLAICIMVHICIKNKSNICPKTHERSMF